MITADIKDVSMTYSSALEIAKAIDNKRLDFNGMRGTLENLVDSLSGQWEGTTQREFLTAYNKLKLKLKLISETMERYSKEIRAVVAAEEDQDKTSSTEFKGIDYWFRPIGNSSEPAKNDKQSKSKKSKKTQEKAKTEETPQTVVDPKAVSVKTPLNAQQTHYNCAFASGSMLLNAVGIAATEDDIIRQTGGDTNLYEVNKAMNALSGGKFNEIYCEKGEAALQEAIENSLRKGVPVQVNVSLPTSVPFGYPSAGHYVVVTGQYTGADGRIMVTINDPYSPEYFQHGIVKGQTLEMSLSSLSNVRGHEWLIVGA